MAPLAGSSSRWALSSRLPVPAQSSAGGSGWCLHLGYVQTSVPARNVVVALFGTLADAPAPMRASWDKKAFVLKKRRWGPERLFSINLLTVYIMAGVFGDFWLHKGESTVCYSHYSISLRGGPEIVWGYNPVPLTIDDFILGQFNFRFRYDVQLLIC